MANHLSPTDRNKRDISPALAARIEVATKKQVMRWDCRPDDWYVIWPELVRAKGAPAGPTEKAV